MQKLNPESWPKQTLFAPQMGLQATGNCFQVCLACVMNLPVDEVPHFYADTTDMEVANARIQEFMFEHNAFLSYFDGKLLPELVKLGNVRLPTNNVVILTGKSPRGDWHHGVLVTIHADGTYTVIHDPHPDNLGVVGEPTSFEVITYVPTYSA